jgi:hypothetical protein
MCQNIVLQRLGHFIVVCLTLESLEPLQNSPLRQQLLHLTHVIRSQPEAGETDVLQQRRAQNVRQETSGHNSVLSRFLSNLQQTQSGEGGGRRHRCAAGRHVGLHNAQLGQHSNTRPNCTGSVPSTYSLSRRSPSWASTWDSTSPDTFHSPNSVT